MNEAFSNLEETEICLAWLDFSFLDSDVQFLWCLSLCFLSVSGQVKPITSLKHSNFIQQSELEIISTKMQRKKGELFRLSP